MKPIKKKSPDLLCILQEQNLLLTYFIILLVSLSEWSEWTPCSPCVPASSLLHSDSATGDGGEVSGGLGMSETALVSVQIRYRTCLDVDSGLPVNEREGECSKPLQEERICPQPDICKGHSQYSLTGVTLLKHHECQLKEICLTNTSAPYSRGGTITLFYF